MNDKARKSIIEGEVELLNEQIKLMNQLAGLYANQAKYENDATKSKQQREKIQRKIAELERNGIKNIETEADLDRRRLRADQDRLKLYLDLEDVIESTNKKEEEALDNRIKKAKEYKKQQEDINKLEKAAEKRRKEIAKQNPNASTTELNRAFSNDDTLKNILKNINRNESQNNTSEYMKETLKSIKIGNSNVGKYVEMNEKGISTKALAIQTIVDTFSKAVEVFSSSVKQGFQNQTNAYENGFTNIAVRTGMSKSTYRNNQMRLGGFGTNILNEQGLMNNIRTSEVQEMWGSLANIGMNQEDILSTSLESVITKTIVPYLDVTSEELQQFNLAVGENGLLKQVRGINKVSQEEFGSSMITQKYLQEALEYMSPMADAANIDLLKNTVGGVEMLQYLQSEEGGNLSTSAIAKMYRRTTGLQENLIGSLNSGDLTTRLAAQGILMNGVNQYEDMAGVNNQSFIAQNTIKNLTPNNANLAAIFSNATGTDGFLNWEILKKNPDLLGAYSKGIGAAGKLGGASTSVTNSLANDEFHTTRQLTDILAENLTNEVSAFAEMLGPWFDVLTTAVKGIATIIGVKLLGKVGGSILGKIGGSAGSAAGGSAISSGLSSIGGGLAGTEATSTVMGGLGTIAGVAAGGAMAVHGGLEMVNDIKEGDAMRATMSGVEMAAGATAAGAFIAAGISNPVGWVALAVGGAALLGKHLYDLATETGDISDELNAQSKIVLDDFKTQHEQREDELYELKDKLKQEDDIQKQKKMLIDAGIATEKQLQDEQYNSKEALINLTNQYIASTRELNGASEEILTELEDKQNDEQNEIAKNMYNLMNMNYKDMNDGQKQAAADFGRQYYNYIEGLAANGDKDAQWRLDEWEKKGINLRDGNFTKDDLYAIKNLGSDKTNNQFIKQFFTDSDRVHKLTTYDTVQNYLGRDGSFSRTDYSAALTLVQNAILEQDIEKAKGMLAQAKQQGLTWDVLGSVAGGKKFQDDLIAKGISSYRIGTDNIPYDNYPALLHEGEAVLTASTANELRSLVDEYRNTKYDSAKIEKAIQDQTAVLVESLNAIYTKIPSSEESQAKEVMPGNLQQNYRKMTLPFN